MEFEFYKRLHRKFYDEFFILHADGDPAFLFDRAFSCQ